MRKKLATIVLSMFAVAAMAQDTDSRKANIDWKEDSVEITTIKDIVRTQQAVTSRTATAAHFDKVWKNHGFFNVAYHTKATLDPVATYNLLKKNNEEAKYIETGVAYNGGKAPKFTNNWGASIMAGKNIKLHKPIANTLQFNIDFTGIDLSVSHYSTEPGVNDDKKDVLWEAHIKGSVGVATRNAVIIDATSALMGLKNPTDSTKTSCCWDITSTRPSALT